MCTHAHNESGCVDTKAPELSSPGLQFGATDEPSFPSTWHTAEDFALAWADYVDTNQFPPFQDASFPSTRSRAALIRASLAEAAVNPDIGPDLAGIECAVQFGPGNATAKQPLSTIPSETPSNVEPHTFLARWPAHADYHPCTHALPSGALLTSFATNSSFTVLVVAPERTVNTTAAAEQVVVFLRAVDLAGNLGAPIAAVWSLDRQPPLVTLDTLQLVDSGTGFSAIAAAQFSFTATDPAPGSYHPTSTQPMCRVVSPLYARPPSFQPCTSPWSFDVTAALNRGPGFGAFAFQLRAADVAGNADPCDPPTLNLGNAALSRADQLQEMEVEEGTGNAVPGTTTTCLAYHFHVATIQPAIALQLLIPNATATGALFHPLSFFETACRGVSVTPPSSSDTTSNGAGDGSGTCVFPSNQIIVSVHQDQQTPLPASMVFFECQLDSPTWSPCLQANASTAASFDTTHARNATTSNSTGSNLGLAGAINAVASNASAPVLFHQFASLVDGSHVLHVRARTRHGLVSEVASFRWTTDTTASAAVIADAPPLVSTSTSARFSFTSADADLASFRCTLDGDPVPCSSGAIAIGTNASSDASHATASPGVAAAFAERPGAWTPWINAGAPTGTSLDGGGDLETAACPAGQVLWAMQCRTACDPAVPDCEQLPAQDTGQVFHTPCPAAIDARGVPSSSSSVVSAQLHCRHADQRDGRPCLDYEVRAFCGAAANTTRVVFSARDDATFFVDGAQFVRLRSSDGVRVFDMPRTASVVAVAAVSHGDAGSGRVRVSLPLLGRHTGAQWRCSAAERWATDLSWTQPGFDDGAEGGGWLPAAIVTAALRPDVDAALSSGHSAEAKWIWAQQQQDMVQAAASDAASTEILSSELPKQRVFCRRSLVGDADGSDQDTQQASLIPQPLRPGQHRLQVWALDQAGNSQARPTVYDWRVDTSSAAVNVTHVPAADNGYRLGVGFTGDDAAPFHTSSGFAIAPQLQLEVDGTLIAQHYCVSPALACADNTCRILDACGSSIGTSSNSTASGECEAQLQSLGCESGRSLPITLASAHGPHAIAVRARDAAGNIGPWTNVTFLVDAVPPALQAGLATNSSNATTSPMSFLIRSDGDTDPLVLTREERKLRVSLLPVANTASTHFGECVQELQCLVRAQGSSAAAADQFAPCPLHQNAISCFARASGTVLLRHERAVSALLASNARAMQQSNSNSWCAAERENNPQRATCSELELAKHQLRLESSTLQTELTDLIAASMNLDLLGFRMQSARFVSLPPIAVFNTTVPSPRAEPFGAAEAAYQQALSSSQETAFEPQPCVASTASISSASSSSSSSSLSSGDVSCSPTLLQCLWSCAAAAAGNSTNCTSALPTSPLRTFLECSNARKPDSGTAAAAMQQATARHIDSTQREPPAAPHVALALTFEADFARTGRSYAEFREGVHGIAAALNSPEASELLASTLQSALDADEGSGSGGGATVLAMTFAVTSVVTDASISIPKAPHSTSTSSSDGSSSDAALTTAALLLASTPSLLDETVIANHLPSCSLVACGLAQGARASVHVLLSPRATGDCSAEAAALASASGESSVLQLPLRVARGADSSTATANVTLRVDALDTHTLAQPSSGDLGLVASGFDVLAQLEAVVFEAAPVLLPIYHASACPDAASPAALCLADEASAGEGEQELLVRAVDGAGNLGAVLSTRLYWDVSLPTLVWTARPARISSSAEVSTGLAEVQFDFEVLDTLPQSVRQSLATAVSVTTGRDFEDEGPVSLAALGLGTASYKCALVPVPSGQVAGPGLVSAGDLAECKPPVSFRIVAARYMFAVVASDALGNEGQLETYAFEVAEAAPQLSLTTAVQTQPFASLSEVPPLEFEASGERLVLPTQTLGAVDAADAADDAGTRTFGSSGSDTAALECAVWWSTCLCTRLCLRGSAAMQASIANVTAATEPVIVPCPFSPLNLSAVLPSAIDELRAADQRLDLFWIHVNVSLVDAAQATRDPQSTVPVTVVVSKAQTRIHVLLDGHRYQDNNNDAATAAGVPSLSPTPRGALAGPTHWLSVGAVRHGVEVTDLLSLKFECRVVTFDRTMLVAEPAAFVLTSTDEILQRGAVFASSSAIADAREQLASEPWFSCTTPVRVPSGGDDEGLVVFSARAVDGAGLRTTSETVAWVSAASARPNITTAPSDIEAAVLGNIGSFASESIALSVGGDDDGDVTVDGADAATRDTSATNTAPDCRVQFRVSLWDSDSPVLRGQTQAVGSTCHANHTVSILCGSSAVVATGRVLTPGVDSSSSSENEEALFRDAGASVNATVLSALLQGRCIARLEDAAATITSDSSTRVGTLGPEAVLTFSSIAALRLSAPESKVPLGMECCAGQEACLHAGCHSCGDGVCATDCGLVRTLALQGDVALLAAKGVLCDCRIASKVESCDPGLAAVMLPLDNDGFASSQAPLVFGARYVDEVGGRGAFSFWHVARAWQATPSSFPVDLAAASGGASSGGGGTLRAVVHDGQSLPFGPVSVSHSAPEQLLSSSNAWNAWQATAPQDMALDAYWASVEWAAHLRVLPPGIDTAAPLAWPGVSVGLQVLRVGEMPQALGNDLVAFDVHLVGAFAGELDCTFEVQAKPGGGAPIALPCMASARALVADHGCAVVHLAGPPVLAHALGAFERLCTVNSCLRVNSRPVYRSRHSGGQLLLFFDTSGWVVVTASSSSSGEGEEETVGGTSASALLRNNRPAPQAAVLFRTAAAAADAPLALQQWRFANNREAPGLAATCGACVSVSMCVCECECECVCVCVFHVAALPLYSLI